MRDMRSGFKGVFNSGKGGKANPKQFAYILGGLFVVFALIFFGTR